jgi:phosphoglycolate phosphatase
MTFRAVIFDLDGTLLDTLEDIADSANSVLRRRGFPAHPTDEYRYFVGDGVRKLIERILPPEKRTETFVDLCLAEMRQEYGGRWNVKTRPYDGVPELLDSLRGHGVKRAVLSNKPDDLTRACVDELLSDWSFDVVAGYGGEIPHKPDPTGALEVARRLGVNPDRIAMVGDSDIDMRAAVDAGMYPVGATWGFRPREELAAAGALELLDRPLDLLAVIDRDRD